MEFKIVIHAKQLLAQRLFICRFNGVLNLRSLRRNEIRRVLIISRILNADFPDFIRSFHLTTFQENNIIESLNRGFQFVAEARRDGTGVVVTCSNNRNESAIFYIAYFITRLGMSFLGAQHAVDAVWNSGQLTPSQIAQLRALDDNVHGLEVVNVGAPVPENQVLEAQIPGEEEEEEEEELIDQEEDPQVID